MISRAAFQSLRSSLSWGATAKNNNGQCPQRPRQKPTYIMYAYKDPCPVAIWKSYCFAFSTIFHFSQRYEYIAPDCCVARRAYIFRVIRKNVRGEFCASTFRI